MKKAALYLGILTISIFFYSCDAQREDSVYTGPTPDQTVAPLKLAKMTERVFVDDDTLTTDTYFTYNHIGLLEETDNGTVRNEITYSGTKKVTTVATYDGSGLTTNQFNYSGDKLLNITGNGTTNNKEVYSYANDKVSSKDYFELESNAFMKRRTVKYTYSGDNVSQQDEARYVAGDTLNTHNVYTFDQKANPFTFLNKYLKMFSGFEDMAPWNIDNKITSSSADADDDTAVPVNYSYSIVTNDKNYPTSIKMIDADGVTVKEWLFEYVETAAE